MAESMIYTLAVICTCVLALSRADLASETVTNSVELKFYRLQTGAWNAGTMEATLAGLVAASANSYCATDPEACGLYACCSAVFKEIDVGKDAEYPINVQKDMKYKLSLNIPAGADIRNDSTLQYVISKNTLQAIIGNIRTDVKTDLGYWITYVGSDFYGIPPADLANKIIIPIAFVILLAVIIVAIAFHFWNKRNEEKERLERKVKMRQEKKNKGKEQPKYNVDTEEPKVPASPDKKTTRHRKKRTEEKIYEGKGTKLVATKKETPSKRLGGASDTDSAIKMEDRSDDHIDKYTDGATKYQSLPPLQSGETKEERRERKKKKKEKKKKRSSSKRRDEDNSAYLGGDSDDGPTTEL